MNSIADLELCLRNPVNVEKKNEKVFTYDRIFKFFRIHFFLFIPKQARQYLFYCNSTVHSLVIAMRQNVLVEITVWLSDLKSPFKLFFRVNKNTTLLALQRSQLLRLDDDGKDKRFPVVGRRVRVSQQKILLLELKSTTSAQLCFRKWKVSHVVSP